MHIYTVAGIAQSLYRKAILCKELYMNMYFSWMDEILYSTQINRIENNVHGPTIHKVTLEYQLWHWLILNTGAHSSQNMICRIIITEKMHSDIPAHKSYNYTCKLGCD